MDKQTEPNTVEELQQKIAKKQAELNELNNDMQLRLIERKELFLSLMDQMIKIRQISNPYCDFVKIYLDNDYNFVVYLNKRDYMVRIDHITYQKPDALEHEPYETFEYDISKDTFKEIIKAMERWIVANTEASLKAKLRDISENIELTKEKMNAIF